MWEKPDCDNCKSKKNKIFLDNITIWEYPGKFRIVECEVCGLKYLNPRPKKEFIKKYYSEKGYWGIDLYKDKTSIKNYKIEREKIYKNIYKNILSLKRKGRIFDVGAGLGLFLSKFKEFDWEVDGVEINKKAARFAKRNFRIKLINSDFNNMKLPHKKYDVVTFNSSLEHLYSPRRALEKVNGILKKGGLLVITVPNIDSLGAKVFKGKWLPLHPPKHLYHFSKDTLRKMLTNIGFVIDKVSYWYFNHGYYGIFNSIRYNMSPKFKKKGKEKTINTKANKGDILSITKKEAEKVGASIISALLTIIGSAIGKGETITFYATKD